MLTRKAAHDLSNRHAGCGFLFMKISDSEIQMIEINLGRNDKFYTINGTELPERLNELSREIKLKEIDG